ncbi:molybdopterin synthase sulfur carrier subunit [Anseongella ginsenosidimutans]|uniref:Molybdopterin synthase sulfur carrier subunit n=1 Tax=Anseongella ginsenosidimutans TaxID=496056 RepID=A0A4R3KY15_9SPHI|nr:molybdopterin converting factor subunit 1 [Anseongella ginsenosidimutans]QEC51165.1 molybdopterin converting factor subunit 1 [Anseongella ginsenosidimutans]TCS90164.1 molybdopterin synthase sulfur carrier subunit [Anseongella ginsenosidimutans]
MTKLLVFGAASEVMGARNISLPPEIDSVKKLRVFLQQHYPGLKRLNSLMVAVNREYAEDACPISGSDEVALIPPVSGG